MTDRRVALTLRRPSSEAAADQVRIRALDISGDHRRSASLIVHDTVTVLKVSAIMLDEHEFLRCLGSSSIAIGKGHNLAMLVGAVRPSIGSSRKEGGDCELLEARKGEPKFYEFNADTPTSLLEAGSIQWLWLEQTGNGSDQHNSITEKLITAWQRNLTHIQQTLGHKPVVHFAVGEGESSGEDAFNVMFLMDTCQQAGWQTKALTVEEISVSKNDGRFYDANGDHLDVIFKLYPWEFMVQEAFAQSCFQDMGKIGLQDEAGNYVGGTIWIEPPYKMLWSNKSIFAILWRLFKDDPRGKWLLPTYVNEAPSSMTSFARKPIFAREGADVVLQRDGKVIQDASTGDYGAEGYVVQELALLPEFRAADGNTYYPVIGLWFIDGDPAGMGIREDRTPITTNTSVFIPHSIEGGPATYEKQRIPDNEEIEEQMRVAPFFDSFGWEENEIVSFMKKIVLS
ncbi:hypothetical protein CGMCC3_g2505 [Colletotrichum fructicola]|nr:uncharacterized protein CGMCC3_g2505 [Colletotrichum fructicola]KAE9581194.1 hypothetical protein CGMCC3_g2505 [Colletotrichum fructicola]KAF4427770.1 putative acid-amine ligase YgiC [Colletotrichum fructicola]